MKIKHGVVNQRGQTLVEVLLATTVVAMVLTAIAAGLSSSVKNTDHAKLQNAAAKYNQETLEIFRRERHSLGWEAFRSALSNGTYCLNDLPADSSSFLSMALGACAAETTIEETVFQRQAVVTVAADEVSVVATVTWDEGGQDKQVELEQAFLNIGGSSPTPTP